MSVTPTAAAVPTIIVDTDAPTDAALVDTLSGGRVLVLRPYQSFSNAVDQITRLLPGMHPDRVRALVRTYLPDAKDFDGLESMRHGTIETHIPSPPVEDEHRRHRHLIRKIIAHTAVWSVLTLAGIGYAVSRGADDFAPYESASFQHFAQLGRLMCDPIDKTRARCVDVDGTVMISTVFTSSDQTVFSFAYGKDNLSMRVLRDPTAAREWVIGGGNHRLYDNATQAGRYVFYGTDAERVREYAKLVSGDTPKSVDGGVDRVMGLAVGALNLPDRIQLVSLSQENAVLSVMGETPDAPKVAREVPVTADYLPAPAPQPGMKHGKPAKTAPVDLPTVGDVLSQLPVKVTKPNPPVVIATAPVATPTPTPTATPTPTQTTPKPTPTPTAEPEATQGDAPDPALDPTAMVEETVEDLLGTSPT